MRFWLANLFDRLWVVVVALAALVIPLSKIVPPLYVWRVRSRVYRWYGELRAVEQALEGVTTGVPESGRKDRVRADLVRRLDDIETASTTSRFHWRMRTSCTACAAISTSCASGCRQRWAATPARWQSNKKAANRITLAGFVHPQRSPCFAVRCPFFPSA